MKSFPNIEKSAFTKGGYVGYACGTVWHITKSTSSFGDWVAFPRELPQLGNFKLFHVHAFGLAKLSAALEKANSEGYIS